METRDWSASVSLAVKESPAAAAKEAVALTRDLNTGGAKGYWKKRLEFSRKDLEDGNGQAYRVAVVYARLGERERALEYLDKAFASRELHLRWIRTESAFAMSDDPRFVDLVRRMGLMS